MKSRQLYPIMPASLKPASADDLPAVEAIVGLANLPLQGVRSQFPAAFVVARDADVVVGVAAVERYEGAGLLRSVAVLPSHRGTGIGRQLVADRLAHAAQLGIREVFLLTTSAAGYFSRLGFQTVSRAKVPLGLADSPEFAGACPASATCLVWFCPR
jgi:amino-acid N-acetyltransferase